MKKTRPWLSIRASQPAGSGSSWAGSSMRWKRAVRSGSVEMDGSRVAAAVAAVVAAAVAGVAAAAGAGTNAATPAAAIGVRMRAAAPA